MTTGAKVFDITPAHLRRTLEGRPAGEQVSVVVNDLADGVEAVHQLANLAGFSERPRAFIFALASAAHKAGDEFVELLDEELAEQQGCSTRTVRRQRADYLKESRERRFGFVEVIEGEYNQGTNQNAPTRYRFHVGGQIAEAVELARRTPGWSEMSRRKQREAVARACEEVFHTIPDARRQRRKGRRPRPAAEEIRSRLKAAETNLDAAGGMASNLPASALAELLDEGGGEAGTLRDRLLRMRAEIDQMLAEAPPETLCAEEVDRGVRTNCPNPPAAEPRAEDVAAWEALERRAAGEPSVVTREVTLRAPPSDEELEAEAVRDEGCGEL